MCKSISLILFLLGFPLFRNGGVLLCNLHFRFDFTDEIDEETEADQDEEDRDERHQRFDEHRPPDDQKDESYNNNHDANNDPQYIRHRHHPLLKIVDQVPTEWVVLN
jgi:uncharacterized Zn finger protein (UPF0148 family)